MRVFSALSSLLFTGYANAALEIVPGATWTAINTGEHIQAHGAGIIQDNGVYYLIGEEKSDGSYFQAVNCYSSSNLLEWSFEGQLLSRVEEYGGLGPNRIIERPKVIKNDDTGKYVMYVHVDNEDYSDARVGVATSDTVCGEYEYQRGFRPLDYQSRDIGLFKDDDGAGYLLSEDREYGTRIIRLTDDYLDVQEVTSGWEYFAESPALVRRGDYYFIFGSHLTGWSPNNNVYSYATSLSSPWSNWTEFAPVDSNTFSSQVNYVLPLGTDQAIYMGDRWVESNLAASTYIWLPIEINGTGVTLSWHDSWSVDIESGTWAESGDATGYEGEDATLSDGAEVISCNDCSGSQAAGYIGGTGANGTAVFNVEVGSAGEYTVIVKYRNGDTDQRFSLVEANGKSQTAAFLSTSHLSPQIGTSTVNVELVEGNNTISLAGDGLWGPDVDVLLVPSA